MKISVITVCYNSIATLHDTLESILRQTYPDVESIVVDGASKDGTVELIEKYSHQFSGRMKWISEPDKGIYDAMNKGIGMATGDVIGFLNADDYYQDENVLETIAEAFARHGTDAVHGNLHYINGAREIVRTWRGTEYTPGSFQRGWNPAHPTFYCKKDCFTRYRRLQHGGPASHSEEYAPKQTGIPEQRHPLPVALRSNPAAGQGGQHAQSHPLPFQNPLNFLFPFLSVTPS